MEKNVVFFKCLKCGNIIGLIEGNIDNIKCCHEEMAKMVANTSEGAVEKHIPVYEKVGDEIIVRVGEAMHPMEEDHYIKWIAQVTEKQTIRVRFKSGENPEARFPYVEGAYLYAYCNKHGLWGNVVK